MEQRAMVGMVGRLALGFVALFALSACENSNKSRFPLACPTPSLIGVGADLTRYVPGGPRDLINVDYEARISGLVGGCNRGGDGASVDMLLTVGFQVEQGPGGVSQTVILPWFVAVIDDTTGAVLSRQTFVESVAFGRNSSRIDGQSEQVTIKLPVTETRKAKDYRILVSFELKPEDLELNRRRGPR
jgi:hypothetical protein